MWSWIIHKFFGPCSGSLPIFSPWSGRGQGTGINPGWYPPVRAMPMERAGEGANPVLAANDKTCEFVGIDAINQNLLSGFIRCEVTMLAYIN